MSEPILRCNELHKRFLVGDGVDAVKDVRLLVMPGEFVVIMGPSGCGKTTLLNLLGGLDRPTHGEVILQNRKFSRLSENQLARMRRTHVGFVFQFFNLLPDLTAAENVALPMRITGVDDREVARRTLELLDEVGMVDRAAHSPHELSGGEQQRVAVARALANRPAVVLADEPTGNLDSQSGCQVMDLFARFNSRHGQTFVIASHDQAFVEYATKVVHMLDGTVVRVEERAGVMKP
ncbi:MAG: ABC transporter ATP-binding protein [Bacillota bacterium]